MRRAALIVVLGLTVVAAGCGERSARAQSTFSLASLKGSYAGQFSGEISTSSGFLPILGTGVFIADGKGNLSGHETYTVNGTECEATISGTYTVASDGSGTDSATFTTSSPDCVSGSYTQGFALDGAGLVLLTNTNADRITEDWHLQS